MNKNILIMATGGTIAGMAADNTTYEGYAPASVGISDIVSAIPELTTLAKIHTEQTLNLASHELTDSDLLLLAKRVEANANSGKYDGIVITHGTNTLEETAYFLNLALNVSIPVVMVGSMRPANSLSPDGPLNLYRAVTVAKEADIAHLGVVLVFNEKIIGAKEVVKSDTISVETFTAPQAGIKGYIIDDTITLLNAALNRHTHESALHLNDASSLPKIGIIYGHLGEGHELFDAHIQSDFQGIVYAGPGTASVTPGAEKGIQACQAAGIPVVRVARYSHGMILPNMEFDDKKYDTIAGYAHSPHKARILLQLSLLKSLDTADIQQFFVTH